MVPYTVPSEYFLPPQPLYPVLPEYFRAQETACQTIAAPPAAPSTPTPSPAPAPAPTTINEIFQPTPMDLNEFRLQLGELRRATLVVIAQTRGVQVGAHQNMAEIRDKIVKDEIEKRSQITTVRKLVFFQLTFIGVQ